MVAFEVVNNPWRFYTRSEEVRRRPIGKRDSMDDRPAAKGQYVAPAAEYMGVRQPDWQLLQ
jgi:hypothetical protein